MTKAMQDHHHLDTLLYLKSVKL